MTSYSFRTLGSKGLHQQVIKDIEDLLKTCQLEKLLPLHLVIGRTFLVISCAQYIRNELKIKDWDYQVSNNYKYLLDMHKEVVLNTIRKCEKNYGVFDTTDNFTVFFNPEEEYLAIHAINISKVDKHTKKVTNKCIEVLRYEVDDILKDFNPDKHTH